MNVWENIKWAMPVNIDRAQHIHYIGNRILHIILILTFLLNRIEHITRTSRTNATCRQIMQLFILIVTFIRFFSLILLIYTRRYSKCYISLVRWDCFFPVKIWVRAYTGLNKWYKLYYRTISYSSNCENPKPECFLWHVCTESFAMPTDV